MICNRLILSILLCLWSHISVFYVSFNRNFWFWIKLISSFFFLFSFLLNLSFFVQLGYVEWTFRHSIWSTRLATAIQDWIFHGACDRYYRQGRMVSSYEPSTLSCHKKKDQGDASATKILVQARAAGSSADSTSRNHRFIGTNSYFFYYPPIFFPTFLFFPVLGPGC